MHTIKSNFDKIVQTIKSLKVNCFDETGNIPKPGMPSLFTDLQVLSLALTAECMSLDNENWLFNKIKSDYSSDFPKLTDRTRYTRRKRPLFPVMGIIRQTLATRFLEFEAYFMVDSMPLEACKLSREKRSKICQQTFENVPDKGCYASQNTYFYGYKLQGICSANGIFHSIEQTKASVHDTTFLREINAQLADCVLIVDKGYLSSSLQSDLLHATNIRLATPMRKIYKKQSRVFRKTRKRVETLFSQLCEKFMIRRIYAKTFKGLRLGY